MQLRKKSPKHVPESTKQEFHKNLEKPLKKTTEKKLEKSTRKTGKKKLATPIRKSPQKVLEKPLKKTPQISEKPLRKLPQKVSKSSKKIQEEILKKPSRHEPLKNLEMPPTKSSQKRVRKPSEKAYQLSLDEPSRKASQKILEKPAKKASQKNSKKPPSKASEKTLKVISSKVSETISKNNKRVSGKQPISCVICKRIFTSQKLLKDHNSKHHFLRHCPNCPKTFQRTRSFVLHLRSHLEDHPYECKVCLESFNQKRDLLTHKALHRNSSKLGCDICPEVFPHLASLNRHRLVHSGPPYPCDDCEAVFSNVPDRTVHLKNHVHRCIMCPQKVVAFPSHVDLASHIYTAHQIKEYDPVHSEVMDSPEPCVSTGAVNLENGDSDSMDDLLSSSDDESNADNYQKDAVEQVYNLKHVDKLMCFICYDLYPSSELLKSHMKAHKWYPCNTCPQFFANAEALKNHVCDSVQVPSYQCKICNSEIECKNCKKNCQVLDVISECDTVVSESISNRFPEMSTLGITDYTDVTQRCNLINFIHHVECQKGPLDLETFNRIGFHNDNLKIILENPGVNSLYSRHCIQDLEKLYAEFQNLSQILLEKVNSHSTQ